MYIVYKYIYFKKAFKKHSAWTNKKDAELAVLKLKAEGNHKAFYDFDRTVLEKNGHQYH